MKNQSLKTEVSADSSAEKHGFSKAAVQSTVNWRKHTLNLGCHWSTALKTLQFSSARTVMFTNITTCCTHGDTMLTMATSLSNHYHE